MLLNIKNMVCHRCILAVEGIFRELGEDNFKISMGVAELPGKERDKAFYTSLKEKLDSLGFELIDDKKTKLIEQIKTLIIEKVHHSDLTTMDGNWSVLLADHLGQEYKGLSRLFSSVEGITIEHYIIQQKIEKVKELIVYDELTLSEIAWKLDYSSVAHLSNQFKKITGMTPKQFKAMGGERRPLDEV
ncbi:MAG: AraC family transcriptional regulator [Cyclobacteriaceae bacterium]|nr:AraC family transcriptional regulator [Cyclobacteriaceae bacterium]